MAKIRQNSGQVGPGKGDKSRERSPHFGYIQSGLRQEFKVPDSRIRSAFPNSTALNPMELPPP
ncbi:hypothetical protein, partial [Streptomyces pseudogriseolus]|uniref:hypothetical protein n=1 Tax=Streptomyces pseudogriseolus TaxID=36817 RepID=UPI003F9F2983